MRLLTKEILYFLSISVFLFNCSGERSETGPEVPDRSQLIDSVFYLAENWTDRGSPFEDILLKEISEHFSGIKGYNLGNEIDPSAIVFTARSKDELSPFLKAEQLQKLSPYDFKSYKVWRSEVNGEELIEYSLQPHPTEKWIFSIRKRKQE
ncbi:MAG: hypothetical protein R3277_03415 [Brumimicrobium sp.]|nr:hypothetical protein [Brumimicrobium sp.]